MSYRKEINDLGTFSSLSQLWATHPEGGKEGDYCTVSGTKYYWNPYANNWESQDADNSYSPAYKNHIVDGDLNVRHDVTIAGTLRVHGLKSHECGLFATSADLRSTYPKPEAGDWAIVGPSDGYYYVYLCEQDGTWIKGPATSIAGGGGGGSSADLSALIARITQAESGISANAYAITQAANAASAAQQSANAAQTSANQAATSAASAVSSAQQAAATAASAQQTAQDAASNASNASIQANAAVQDVIEVSGQLAGKADLDSTQHLKAEHMPRVMLVGIGSTPQNLNDGDIWYINGKLQTAAIGNYGASIKELGKPSSEAIYCLVTTDELYRWDGDKMCPVGGSGGGSIHIDTNPEPGSGSAVSSGGVYSALQSRDITINSLQIAASDYQNNGLKTNDLDKVVPELNGFGTVKLSALPPVILDKIGFNHNGSSTWVGTYFCIDGHIRTAKMIDGSRVVTDEVASENAIYYDKDTELFYRWDARMLRMLAIGSEGGGAPQVIGGDGVIRVEEQDGWSDDFVDPAKQVFTVPDKTFYDFIVYSSGSEVDWTASGNKALNPANWEGKDYMVWSASEGKFVPIDMNAPYAKTWIGTGTTNGNTWTALKSAVRPQGTHVYVSYRTRNIHDCVYSQWSEPMTWTAMDNDPNLSGKVEATDGWDLNKGLRTTFLQNNAEALLNASNARKFLQSVINNARPDQKIVFPQNKTFVIDFDPMGLYDGFSNGRVEYDPYMIGKMLVYSATGKAVDVDQVEQVAVSDTSVRTVCADPEYYNKIVFVGLDITHKVHIDLNGSTIRFIPNWLPNFSVVYIGRHRVNMSWDHSTEEDEEGRKLVVTTDPKDSIIENGTIDGCRDQVMFFGVHARTYDHSGDYFVRSNFKLTDYEHGHTVNASRKVALRSLNVGNTVGDGMCVSSEYSWDQPPGFWLTHAGWINSDGTAEQKNMGEHGGRFYKEPQAIAPFNEKMGKTWELLVRPYYGENGPNAKVDIGPYYVDEYVDIAYYSSSSMSASSFISMERIQYGDMLRIPEGATHFAFCMRIDPSVDPWNSTTKTGLMVCSIIWANGTEIRDCDIHDCGRDGMTLACLKNPVISNNRITRCDQAIIDIESTAYCDDNMHIEGLYTEFDDEAFACKTGDHLMLERSKMCGVYTDNPYIHINDCDLQYIVLGPEDTSRVQKTFNSNISRPRRVVRDTIIRGRVDTVNTVFENCIFTGTFTTHDHDSYLGNYPTTFDKCTFKVPAGDYVGLTPGVYNDCIIRGEGKVQLQMYQSSKPELSKYVMRNCTIDVDSLYTKNNYQIADRGTLLDIDGCIFNLRGHLSRLDLPNLFGAAVLNTNFAGCFVSRITNSVFNFAPNADPSSGKDRAPELFLMPYTNAVIENNVFNPTSEEDNITFIKLYLLAIAANKVYDVVIRHNTVNFYGENSNFLFIQPCTADDDIQVNIMDNVFVGDGSTSDIKDVTFAISTSSGSQDDVTVTAEDVKARLLGNRAVNGEITQATGDNVIRQ